MLSALLTSQLSYPALHLETQLEHQRSVHPGPLVLRTGPLKSPAPTLDRDRTVSRRSEPNSRTTIDRRTAELLGKISLLSPAYLLSVERWPFHSGPPDHYNLLSHLLVVSDSQSSSLILLRSTADFQTA